MLTTRSEGKMMFSRLIIYTISGLLGFLALTGTAQAQATSLGVFDKWMAWKDTDADGVICYVSSQPESSEPAGARRSPIYFLVTHRQGKGIRNEVATILGYPTDDNTSSQATIDGRSYPFVSDASVEAAWLASDSDEAAFVAAMKAGSRMVVKATSQRGTKTTDNYSLIGVTKALAEADKSCPPR
jgi:invasion associated locus B (IalB) protein